MIKINKKIEFDGIDDWIVAIANKGPHEDILDHIIRHATEHIKHEPFNDWVDSMLNLLDIYNEMKYRHIESAKNRFKLLKKYRKKHNSEI